MAAVLPGVETIFGEALEITGDEERAAFLDRATGGNPELRRQVESLLEAHPGNLAGDREASVAFARASLSARSPMVSDRSGESFPLM